jgi:hypothetical protein
LEAPGFNPCAYEVMKIWFQNLLSNASCTATARFVPGQDVLLLVTLRLLLNLSFDPTLRQQMVDRSMIPRVVELMKNPHFQHVSMALLYHISMDDKCKSMFTYTAAVPIILDFLLQVEDLHSAPELIALAVNLTQNQRNAEVLCETIAVGRCTLNQVDP